jgi:hypothetical protein
MPTRHHNLTKGDAIRAVLTWLLRLCARRLWVSLRRLLECRRVDKEVGRRIHMRRRGVCLSRRPCIRVGVLCGMLRKFVVVVVVVVVVVALPFFAYHEDLYGHLAQRNMLR